MKRESLLTGICLASVSVANIGQVGAQEPDWVVIKNGIEIDLRSAGRQEADEIAANGVELVSDETSPVPGVEVAPQIQLRGVNVQANDGNLDNIQEFEFFRSFIDYTQSETSVAAHGLDIVAGYNNSADQPLIDLGGGRLVFAHRHLSGFSTSNDGGQTWASGSIPPPEGSIFTLGDPSVDVDRNGNFYYASLGANSNGRLTIQVSASIDGGRTWSPSSIVQQDNGGDKEWIAVGKDPNIKSRDNVYVTWTSFQSTGTQLRFGRSIDSGKTWETKTIFAPARDTDPRKPQNRLQYSNPYVDQITGTIYVPFLHFSSVSQDFLRILISEDGGETFSLATFNVPGAPDPFALPVVEAGTLIDCGFDGGFRVAIHAGENIGGRFNRPSYVQASRLVLQPALAARNGVVYLAWSNSTSAVFGDPESGANILFIRSDDGGKTWTAPLRVNPTVAGNDRHVLPAIAIDADTNDIHIAYYTQHADGSVDVDLANSHDHGATFPVERTVRVSSQSTTLAPTNIPLAPPSGSTYFTTNYDRLLRPCYNLGEYLSVRSENGNVHVLWGDARGSVTHPINTFDPLSGKTHVQQDVFYQKVKAQ